MLNTVLKAGSARCWSTAGWLSAVKSMVSVRFLNFVSTFPISSSVVRSITTRRCGCDMVSGVEKKLFRRWCEFQYKVAGGNADGEGMRSVMA